MAKFNYFILLLLLLILPSKQKPQQLQINFDYSHLGIGESFLKKKIMIEFEKIAYFFKNLLLSENHDSLYKINKKNPKRIIKCDNPKINLKYESSSINKKTSLLIFPRITINSKSNRKNNPVLRGCIKKGIKTVVFILDFEYKSKNETKKFILKNFKNQKYFWEAFKLILSALGFNKNSFSKKNIINNILLKNSKAVKSNNFYKAYEKFSFLTDLKNKNSKNEEKFLNLWPNFKNFYDVMKEGMNPTKFNPVITEMTIGAMEKLGYKVNPCELILYKQKCYRPNYKCLNDFNYDDYFLEYALDTKKRRWICYYKTEKHFKNKQCSSDYGVLLPHDEIKKKFLLIDYFRKKDFQTIRLLKPAPTCPKPHPRTVFYMTVKEKEDPYQFKILDRVEEITIKDPNYFVIADTFSYDVDVKTRAATYNNILAMNTKGWNFNYFWRMFANYKGETGLNLERNKYQIIGKYPFENTFKDGINIYYNKLKAKFPEEFNYIPETYLFPSQKEIIYQKFHDYHYNPEDVWLFKPARDLKAHGIKIIDNYNDIKKSKIDNFLISRYVMNPLLIDNKKFDMRAYILVTGMNPLKIYFYRDGYIKISVKDFTLDHKHIRDGCIHITTSDTNLICYDGKKYKYDTHIYDENSNFWSYVYFERYCAKHGINYTDIMEQMKDIFIKTMISLNPSFMKIMKEKHQYDSNFYHLYGLDLMIDKNNKVILLELNRNPALRYGHGVCDYMYDNIATDVLNIVGIVPFNHNETQQILDKDIYKYDDEMEEIVDDCLCEFGRPRGMFELIYPLKDNINKYKKYYEKIYPESLLLWKKLLKSNGEYN